MTNLAILEAIGHELVSIERSVAQLRERIHLLAKEASVETEGRQPDPSGTPQLPVVLTSNGAFHPRGFWHRGNFHRCSTQIDVYIGLLRAIAFSFPRWRGPIACGGSCRACSMESRRAPPPSTGPSRRARG